MATVSLSNITKNIKEYYLPAFGNQLATEPDPFLEMIKKVPCNSSKEIGGVKVGLNGGFAFGGENDNIPTASGRAYERFVIQAKNIYVMLEITDKAIKLGDNTGVIYKTIDDEIQGAYESAKFNKARALFGNGTGKLGTFASALSASTTVTLDTVQNLQVGMVIEFYTGSVGSATLVENSARKITGVDRTNKQITLDSAITTSGGGFVVNQKSYGNEYTGLGAIFDSSVTSIWGVSKASNPWIKPVSVSASHNLTNTVISRAVRQARDDKGSNIDLIMMADDTFDEYQTYMDENTVTVVPNTRKFKSGAAGYEVVVGGTTITVVSSRFVPSGKAWGVDTTAWEMHETGFGFAAEENAPAFQRKEGSAAYQALLTQYGELSCRNPGGSIEITDCLTA